MWVDKLHKNYAIGLKRCGVGGDNRVAALPDANGFEATYYIS